MKHCKIKNSNTSAKILVLLMFLIFNSAFSYQTIAQSKQTQNDEIIVYPVPENKIENFRNDNDFKYIEKESPVNFWAIIWYYFQKFLAYIFSNEGAVPYVRFAVLTILIILIVIRLFRADFSGIFGRNKKSSVALSYLDEDIRGINFDKEIDKAISRQDYRLAIRYLYLKLLSNLDSKGFIDWLPGKTNRKYLQELKNLALRNQFEMLSRIYEYSWYGNFEPDENQFRNFSLEFTQTIANLNKMS